MLQHEIAILRFVITHNDIYRSLLNVCVIPHSVYNGSNIITRNDVEKRSMVTSRSVM